MELRISAYDITDLDRAIEQKFNVSEEYGNSLFDDNQRIDLNNYDYSLEPYTYITALETALFDGKNNSEQYLYGE